MPGFEAPPAETLQATSLRFLFWANELFCAFDAALL